MIDVKPYLEKLEMDTATIHDFVKNEISHLDVTKLYHKDASKQWSIIECLAHINLANRHYVETMEQKISDALSEGLSPIAKYKQGFLGRMAVKSMTPTENAEIKSKMNTMKRFRPSVAKDQSEQVFETFFDLTSRLQEQIESAKLVNLDKVRIVSAIGPLLVFKLGDALGFVVGHTQRHILQIQRKLSSLESPQNANV